MHMVIGGLVSSMLQIYRGNVLKVLKNDFFFHSGLCLYHLAHERGEHMKGPEYFSCVVFLLENGAKLRQDLIANDSVITCAVENNQVECLQVLLDLNIWGDVLSATMSENPGFRSLVWLAIDNDSPECLELLIKHGAFIDLNDPRHGYSPAFYATLKGHAKCLDLLLTVCPSIPNHETRHLLGWHVQDNCIIQTPIQISAALGNVECLKVLLGYPDQRAFINWEDEFGGTAFWYAARNRHTKCMELLLEAGASPFSHYKGHTVKYGTLPRPAENYLTPFYPSIGAVLHHEHVCIACKLDDTKACGGLRQEYQDYSKYPRGNSKKCIQCPEGICNCDTLEDCLEMFSVDYMQKYIGRIPGVDVDAIERLLNDGFAESIHLVQPETLRLILSLGANLYKQTDRWSLLRISVPGVYEWFIREGHQCDHGVKNLAVCAISFLQWLALYNRHSASKVKKEIFECIRVIMDYCQTVDKLTVKNNDEFDIGEAVLLYLAGGKWIDGLKFVLNSGLVKATYQMVLTAATFHQMPMKKTKLLLFHEASVDMPKWLKKPRRYLYDTKFSIKFNLIEVFELSLLLLAAGFHKLVIANLLIKLLRNTNWRPRYTNDQRIRFNEFLKELRPTTCISLLNSCRNAIGQHLIAANPNTNLFHLVPRLPLPCAVQDFLLYNMELDATSL